MPDDAEQPKDRVTVTLSPDILGHVDGYAKAHGVSRSLMVEQMLRAQCGLPCLFDGGSPMMMRKRGQKP